MKKDRNDNRFVELHLDITVVQACHQCESYALPGVLRVGPSGKAFIFCNDDCLRTWINEREAQIVREVGNGYKDIADEMDEMEQDDGAKPFQPYREVRR